MVDGVEVREQDAWCRTDKSGDSGNGACNMEKERDFFFLEIIKCMTDYKTTLQSFFDDKRCLDTNVIKVIIVLGTGTPYFFQESLLQDTPLPGEKSLCVGSLSEERLQGTHLNSRHKGLVCLTI